MEKLGRLSTIRQRAGLLIAPLVLVLGFLVVKDVSGPYFLADNFDPDYAYILNGLNLAIGRSPSHIDHPGTPVQFLSAAVVRIHNPGQPQGQTALNTISNAETYLDRTNLVIFSLILLSLVTATVVIERKTRSQWPVILFQSSLAFLGVNIYCLSRVNPEPMLVAISLLLGAFIYVESLPGRTAYSWGFVVVAALLCATGTACKVSFLPLVLLPAMIIKGWQRKTTYLLVYSLCFSLWLIPIAASLGRFGEWIAALVIRTGHYGQGNAGIIDFHSYSREVIHICLENFPFVSLVVASLMISAYMLWIRPAAGANELPARVPLSDGVTPTREEIGGDKDRSLARALFAVALCQLLQIAVVCKHHESRYLIPSVVLAGVNLLLLHSILKPPAWQRCFRAGWIVLVICGLLQSVSTLGKIQTKTAQHLNVFAHAENTYSNSARIFGYGASSPYYALYFGNGFAGHLYDGLLNHMSPDTNKIFFYNNFKTSYHTYCDQIPLSDVLARTNSVIFQSPPFNSKSRMYAWPAALKLQERFGGSEEKIYEAVR